MVQSVFKERVRFGVGGEETEEERVVEVAEDVVENGGAIEKRGSKKRGGRERLRAVF